MLQLHGLKILMLLKPGREYAVPASMVQFVHRNSVPDGTWINFARTGNPNGRGVPEWQAYTTAKKGTMIFDAPECEMRYGHDAGLLKIALRK